jgi:hypothetical protein
MWIDRKERKQMRKILLSGVVIVVALFWNACKEPYEEKVSIDPADQLEVFKSLQNLPENEKSEVEQYIARVRAQQRETGMAIPAPITVRQALDEQAKWRTAEAEKKKRDKEREETAAKAKEEKKAKALVVQKEMLEICSVDVTKKLFLSAGGSGHFNIELTFSNKGNKDLVLVKGELQLYDGSGKLLKGVKIPYGKTIKAGKSSVSKGDFPYSENKPGDKILEKIALKDLKVKWVPLTYQFSDGTSITSEL